MAEVPCQCEHELHFATPRTVHEYLKVPAGETCAMFIGPICDACVAHMQGYLLSGEDAERSRRAVTEMYENFPKEGPVFHKTTTTEGVQDLSGEQVEVFTVGDKFQVAAHAVTPHNWEPGQELTVSFVEYNDEDPNDFLIYYVDDGELQHIHRMDVERLFEPKQRVWVGVITDDEGQHVYVADSQEHLEGVIMDTYHHGMTRQEAPSFAAWVADVEGFPPGATKVHTDCYSVEGWTAPTQMVYDEDPSDA